MRAIGTGEAQRSVTVYPDVTGIIETVPFKSGDTVAVGDVLANLQDDTEEVAVERARIAIEAAEAKIERVERLQASRTITAVEVTDARRELDNAKLDLRAAEVDLAKRRIVAPIAGRVGIVSVDTGDLVTNQTVITTIDDRSKIKVIFFTPETFVQNLTIGAPIEAVSTARPEKVHTGVISAIDSRLDEASRTLRTEAVIDNPEDELRPGMSFAMTLVLPGETLLSVDPLSVQWERNGPIVWTIKADNTVEKTAVRIVERNIDRVLVASDALREDDLVVVEGVQALREGGKVEIQNSQQPGIAVPEAKEEPVAGAGGGGIGSVARAAERPAAVPQTPGTQPTRAVP
jgi:RND family efflux transporter MFP subunit